jgi:serine phosphatase RsbU (regulator of sigma subunit)
VAVVDRDLRVLTASATFVELAGRDPHGATLDELVTGLAGELARGLQATLAGNPPAPRVPITVGARRFEVTYFLVDAGSAGFFANETTERDTALARMSYAARASAALAESLDLPPTLETIARLAVPEIADWAFVELLQDDGSIQRVAWAAASRELETLMATYDARWPLDPDSPIGSPRVVRTGEPELITEMPEGWLDAAAQDPEHREVLEALGFASALIVPLVARGRVIGDLALAYAQSGRRYAPEDLEALRALADACALAIDNARLFGEQQTTARALQQSLLPPRLPDVPGVELSARYRPFGSGAEVGGDFYDVFPVGRAGEEWAVVIGDVAGKGPTAAATTGFLRHMLRLAGHLEVTPGAVLRRLDDAVLRELDPDLLATALYAVLRPRDDGIVDVTLASAGHPPPVVRRADGQVEFAVRPGQMLGALVGPPPPEAALTLLAGDVLVLYTDGVTEARTADGWLGEEGLIAAVAAAPPSAAAVASEVEQRALDAQEGRPRDDIAVLTVGVPR